MSSCISTWSPATRRKRQRTDPTFPSSFGFQASGNYVYIPDDDVRFIRWAPNFGAAGLAPLPLPADKGLALVVGAGAAMEAQGSSSSVVVDFKFKDVFGAGAAMAPHKSSSSSLLNLGVFLDFKLEAKHKTRNLTINTRIQHHPTTSRQQKFRAHFLVKGDQSSCFNHWFTKHYYNHWVQTWTTLTSITFSGNCHWSWG